MTRAKDISKILTDADISGTLDVSGAFTSQGIDDNADAVAITIDSSERVGIGNTTPDGGKLHVTNSTGAIGYFQSTQASANVENIILNSTQTNSSSNLSFQINDGTTAKGQLRLNGDNSIAIHNTTSLTERMRIDSSGLVGIGTTSPSSFNGGANNLVVGTGSGSEGITIFAANDSNSAIFFADGDSTTTGQINYLHASNDFTFHTNGGTERMRIHSDGNVSIGTGSASANLHVQGTSGNDQVIVGNSAEATQFRIRVLHDDQTVLMSRDGDTARHLVFQTGITEKMRIDTAGNLLVGTTSTGGASGISIMPNASNGSGLIIFDRSNTTLTSTALNFENNNTASGSVAFNNSSTFYNTSSDYRLKENVTYEFDATSRLKQLKPARFNFKIDADTTVDGFLAHEVSSIVPEAISGEKDATNEDGSIKPQGIDQSKLVPLLVKTIQELEARITALEGA